MLLWGLVLLTKHDGLKSNETEVENRGYREMWRDGVYKDFPQVPI